MHKSSRTAMSEKYLRERFVMKGDIFFSWPRSSTITIISASAELFGKFRFSLFGHSRARRTGDWASANYISLAQAYMRTKERERERGRECTCQYIRMYTCGPHRSLRQGKEKVRIETAYCNCFYLCMLGLYVLRTRPEFTFRSST